RSVAADDMRSLTQRQAETWGEMRGLMRKAFDIASSNVAVVDQANRTGLALAAYRLAKRPGALDRMAKPWLEHNEVFRDLVDREGLSPDTFGKFMLSEAAFEWGRHANAPMMRGGLGRALFALHGFQTRYLSTAL